MRYLVLFAALLAGCTPCAFGDHSAPECRVAAENTVSQLEWEGAILRVQPAQGTDASSWDALGVLWEEAGAVHFRPATLSAFALSIDARDADEDALPLVLHNLAPQTELRLGPAGAEQPLSAPRVGLRAELSLPLVGAETLWLRGDRPCGEAFRLAVAGDIQTNPTQFEEVLAGLATEASEAEAAGAPLFGLLLLGDLAEDPVEEELRLVADLLERSPVPVSVVPGNHDVHGDEYALFNRVFGPGTYAQRVCGARVVLLDTGAGDLAPSVQARLPELLARADAELLVVGSHYPTWPGRTGNGWGNEDAAFYLMSEMVRNQADLYVSGHYHSWEEMPAIPVAGGELHQIISGTAGADQGAGDPRYGFTRLEVAGSTLSSCFVEVEPLEGHRAASGPDIIRTCP